MLGSLAKSIGLVVLLLAATFTSGASAGAQDDADAAVAGRLGGRLQSFVERFGEPVGKNEAAGSVFTAEGFGLIFVQIDHVQGTVDPEGRARSITASAPRNPDLPAGEPDDADWTVKEATQRAKDLLPADAKLSKFAEGASGELTATCRSDALEELFGALTMGQCRVSLIRPTPKTVSYATLSLIAGADASAADTEPAANPCEGAVDWIKQAGERLAHTRDLLGRVTAIDETDPGAPATLREIAASFDELAAEQRASDPPGAAAQANYYLVSALTSYADAVEIAAEGLETGDGASIENAAAGIERAGRQVSQAVAEIEAAGETCALQLGTPVPEASPRASTAG